MPPRASSPSNWYLPKLVASAISVPVGGAGLLCDRKGGKQAAHLRNGRMLLGSVCVAVDQIDQREAVPGRLAEPGDRERLVEGKNGRERVSTGLAHVERLQIRAREG